MSSHRLARARVLVAVLVALAIWAPVGAIRLDWTADEIRCAQTVGVDLAGDPNPGSNSYVKRLAWLADLVVYGVVDKIRLDSHSSFPAKVRIKVLSVRKGRVPKGPLTVEAREIGEPSFSRGETVLLFLTKGTLDPGSGKYVHSENSYGLVDDAKFLIDGTTATLQGWGQGQYNVVQSDYQIRQVVNAQATNCR
jgi:hypothetical protein